MKKEILLFKSYSDEDGVRAVSEVIRRGTYWAMGPEIKEFEEKVAEFTGRKYAISFNSGTSALHANLLAQGITSGEVIVPSFTFPATANSVVAVGAKPVFADIEPETFGLDAEDVQRKINENTKAIIPINFAGDISKDINELRNIADENNIPLIEDNAHSIGAKLNGKMAGTFGDSAMLSFAFNKILPTGEGGMIITDSDEIKEKLELLKAHGRSDKGKKDYITWGLNLRMPSMVAALGLSQFKKLNFLINSRRNIAQFYNDKFKGIKELKLPIPLEGHYCIYQLYNLIFEDENTRNKFKEYMTANGIGNRVTYFSVHLYSFFKEVYNCKEGNLPVTEDISKRILTIPLYPGLSQEDLDYIVSKTKKFFK